MALPTFEVLDAPRTADGDGRRRRVRAQMAIVRALTDAVDRLEPIEEQLVEELSRLAHLAHEAAAELGGHGQDRPEPVGVPSGT